VVWFFIALWTFIDPGFYQRCAAARTPAIARKGILISVFFWFIFDSLTLIAGLYARAHLPESQGLFSLPLLGLEILPTVFYGLFLTGLIATIMSTIDSLGLISAVTFGRDILWRIKNQNTSIAENSSVIHIQLGLLVTSLIAVVMALSVPSVVNLWYLTGSIIVPGLLIPFLFTFTGYTFKNAKPLILVITPVVVSLLWFIFSRITGQYLFNLEPFYPGMISSIIITLLLMPGRMKR
jgi:SSS family solute:Na+ symporter